MMCIIFYIYKESKLYVTIIYKTITIIIFEKLNNKVYKKKKKNKFEFQN